MRSVNKIVGHTAVLVLVFGACVTDVLSQTYTNTVTIEPSVYGPKLILNDSVTTNKVPIEFRSNDAIKWEFGMRPSGEYHDFAIWRFNGSYTPTLWMDHNNGYVGVGTAYPGYRLDVEASTDGLNGIELNNINSGSNTKVGIHFQQGSNDMANIFSRRNNNEFVFQNNQTVSTAGFTFLNSSVPSFRINSNGDIGIGTDTPESKMDINGGISGDVILRLEADTDNEGSEADNPRIEMYQDNRLIYAHIGFNEDTPTPANIFQVAMGSPDGFISNALTINPYTGNLGIGVLTASNKLDVAGTIRAEEVKVETGWADYVFAEDYNLRSLSEVSSYIEENHHLPGIPTAEEVEANGIKLGEMNAKLLEKIEELTLYLIEVKEENNKMKYEINSQKSLNEKLIQRIEKLENL